MADELKEMKFQIDRLELMLTLLIMNEMAKGDPKFMQSLKEVLKKKPSGYFDDIWDKYKDFVSEDSASKVNQIDILIERINLVDKLFNELKDSVEKYTPKEKKD